MPSNWRGHANKIAGSYMIDPAKYVDGDYGLYVMLNDIEAEAKFLYSMGLKKNIYLGHSMGGINGAMAIQGYRMENGDLLYDPEYARMMGEVFENVFLFGNPSAFDYGMNRVSLKLFGVEAMESALEWVRKNTPVLLAPMGNPPGYEYSRMELFIKGLLNSLSENGGKGSNALGQVLGVRNIAKGVERSVRVFDPLLSTLKPLMNLGLKATSSTLSAVGAPQNITKSLVKAHGEKRVSRAIKALLLAAENPDEPGLVAKFMNMSEESVNSLLANSPLSYLWQRDVLLDFTDLAIHDMKTPWHRPRKIIIGGREVTLPPKFEGSWRDPKPIFVKNVFMIGGKHDWLVPGDTVMDYVRLHQDSGNTQVRGIHLLGENHMSMVFEKQMAELMTRRMLDVANNPERVKEMFNGGYYAELPDKLPHLVDQHGELIKFSHELPSE